MDSACPLPPSRAATAVEDITRRVGEALQPLTGVRLAWVFGSRAKGTASEASDLDVGGVYGHGLDAWERHCCRLVVVAALTDALGSVGERADVAELERCDSGVAFEAIRDGRCALARSEEERLSAVVSIGRRYDDAPRRHLFHEAARRLAGAGR